MRREIRERYSKSRLHKEKPRANKQIGPRRDRKKEIERVGAKEGIVRVGKGDNVLTRSDDLLSLDLILRRNIPLEADELRHLEPEAGGRSRQAGLVGIDEGLLVDKVGLVGLDKLGALDELPEDEEAGHEDDDGVGGEEGLDVPGPEAGVAVEDDDDTLDHHGDVGGVGLEPALVGEGVAVDALGLAGAVEEDVGGGHDDVVDETAGSEDVDQPREHLGGAVRDLQEGEEGEGHDHDETVDGHAATRTLGQEARGAPLEGKTVKRANGTVGVGVAGGEDGGEHEGVGDVWEHGNAQVVHGNDVGRCRSSAGTSLRASQDTRERRVVVRQDDADAQGAEDKEHAEAPVDGLEGLLDVDTRPHSLGGHHGDVLGADNTEGGRPQGSQEALKAAERPLGEILGKRPGMRPIAEAISVVLRVAANHSHEGEGEQDQDEYNLPAGKPELSFAVAAHRDDIEYTIIEGEAHKRLALDLRRGREVP